MITGNLDNVDGGLDALMQVAACEKDVGWLKDIRRIIIMASDSLCHFAGDGKLAGIIKPNDGKCHLDENGFYTHALSLDYPSISQIYKILHQNKVSKVEIMFSIVKHLTFYIFRLFYSFLAFNQNPYMINPTDTVKYFENRNSNQNFK